MKWMILISFAIFSTALSAQNECPECSKFKILGVYDMGPPPGGNWVVLLLSVSEDLSSGFDPHYSSLYFVSNQGDTITVPLGGSYTLPTKVSDTIPYVMQLSSPLSNQNFPVDFNGKLVITTPTNGICSNPAVCHINYSKLNTSSTSFPNKTGHLQVSPNPFADHLNINSERLVKSVNIYDMVGQLLYSEEINARKVTIDLGKISRKVLLLYLKFSNGETAIRKVLRVE